ncbi:hypothetical protein ACZ90_50220 [Streptomyces albus subsp. albus]|nr:hypothetical protein ACZ90_50220 [Streptomyces albus subsp. albus]
MNPLGTGDPIRLGPYRLLGVLGEGGMGRVYLGRDDTGRAAAVKVLRRELAADPGMSRRFVREARAAQAVTSGGVARVLGAWPEGGRPWIATEFLAGPTLEEAVERHGPLDGQGVRELGAALAATLQDIHAAGLVHRDLKPSNILLTSDGPRVIDFGIARPEHGLTLTTTGQIPLTPGYGAPEQVLGQRVGPPGDVFALGAVLAYAAGGEPAYQGSHVAAVQYEVVHGEPRLAKVPEPLRTLVARCLGRDPAQRPLPGQLAADLAPAGTGRPAWRLGALAEDIERREAAARRLTELPGAGPSAAPRASARSRRRLLAGLLAGGAVLAGATGGAVWWLGRDDGAGGPGEDGAPPAPRKPWDAEPLSGSQYRRGTAPPALWGPRQGPTTLAGRPVPVRDLVVVEVPEGLAAHDVATGRLRWHVPGADYANCVAPSDRLVVGVDPRGALFGVDTATGEKQWTARLSAVGVLAADRTTVYATVGRPRTRIDTLCAFDLPSRGVRWSVPMPVRYGTITRPAAAVAPGRLVVCGEEGAVVALDTRTGKRRWRLSRQAPPGAGPLPPAVTSGVVYLGGHTLTARALDDGRELWSLPPGRGARGWGAPALDGDALYAVRGTRITRRDRRDGTPDWSHEPSSPPRLAAPVVQGGTIWAAIGDSAADGVAVLHKDSGDPAWTYTRGNPGGWAISAAGNRVFLAHDGTLTAMPVL